MVEKLVDHLQNPRPFLHPVDVTTEPRSVADAMCEVGCELLHLADHISIAVFDQHARPIITASQFVSATIRTASSGVSTSPLPITGIFTAAFTSAIRVQSARPL